LTIAVVRQHNADIVPADATETVPQPVTKAPGSAPSPTPSSPQVAAPVAPPETTTPSAAAPADPGTSIETTPVVTVPPRVTFEPEPPVSEPPSSRTPSMPDPITTRRPRSSS